MRSKVDEIFLVVLFYYFDFCIMLRVTVFRISLKMKVNINDLNKIV